MKYNKTTVHIATLAVLSVAIMARELHAQAIFSCQINDLKCYVNWTKQFSDSLREGIWYPRWMPVSNAGYGNPVFIFYPPLTVLVTAFAYILSGDLTTSVVAVKTAGLFLSGTFMYFFARDLWGWKGGLIAGIVYMALPLRVFNLYPMGIFASKLAYVWFPLILYFTNKAVSERRIGANTASLAVCYALLCLTHLISAYMLAPVLLGFGMVTAGRDKALWAPIRVSAGCLLGIFLSAFYILPATYEQRFVHFEELVNQWWLQYWHNYLYFFFRPEPAVVPLYNHYLARVVPVSVMLGISAYLISRYSVAGRNKHEASFFAVVTLCSLFLMTSLSEFVWANVPGFSLLQFSMRWTSVMTLGIACMTGAAAESIFDKGPGQRKGPKALLYALLLGATAFSVYYDADIIRNSGYTVRRDVDTILADFDVREYVPAQVNMEWLQMERTHPPDEKVNALSGSNADSLTVVEWKPEERFLVSNSGRDAVLRIRTFYYPGWHASVDGKEVPLGTEEVSGAMLLNVPKGRHEVRLCFSDTPLRKAAFYISALAGLLTLYLYIRHRLWGAPLKCCG